MFHIRCLSLFGVTAFMVRLWLVTPLFVTQVKSTLATRSRSLVSADPLVEGKAQGFAIRRLGDTACRDVDGGWPLCRLSFGFSLALAFAFALWDFVGLVIGHTSV